jgi:hypothetical protein
MRVDYEVTCTPTWETKAVSVRLAEGGQIHELSLTVDAEYRWWRAGQELVSCRACRDVDLGFTPVTNTLPIRRLHLEPDSSGDIVAVWVKFPSLDVEPTGQRYTRLSANRYRYENRGSGYQATLVVDDLGLVVDYEGLWRQIAKAD